MWMWIQKLLLKLNNNNKKKKIIFEAEWDSFKPHNEEQPEREKKPPSKADFNKSWFACKINIKAVQSNRPNPLQLFWMPTINREKINGIRVTKKENGKQVSESRWPTWESKLSHEKWFIFQPLKQCLLKFEKNIYLKKIVYLHDNVHIPTRTALSNEKESGN